MREEEGEEEEEEEKEEEERDDRKREEGERFWEDAIMRTVNSETGCERQRLARQQGDAVHRFSALNGCQ